MKKIETYQQLSVLIEAIFENKGLEEFTGNHEKLHTSFFNLKEKFPDYFGRLTFDVNGHYPYSKDLDSIFQDFQICGIINKLNPKFKTYIFKGLDSIDERKKEKIPFVKENDLESISEGFEI
jgi:hypothetical protein